MSKTSTKLSRLAEVEMLRAEIKARRAARRIIIIAVGIIAGGIAIGFLTYGSFLWLAERYGAINAAVSIGAALFVVATSAFAVAMIGPNKRQLLEDDILNRAITEARGEVKEDFDELEKRFNQVSGHLAKLLGARKEGDTGNHSNLATITMILLAVGAVSPTLNRYIQPILKIIS